MAWLLQILIGVLVGIYSYLSPGIINIQIFQLSLQHDWRKVLFIIAFIALLEVPYCMLCMTGFKWLMTIEGLQTGLSWTVFGMMFGMAILLWIKAQRGKVDDENTMVPNKLMSLKSLTIFAIFNPFQLSAWTVWGAYFVDKSWFSWTYSGIFMFSIGASAGAFGILYVYGHIGKRRMHFFTRHKKQLDLGIAGLLFLLSVFQLVKNLGFIQT